jgi:ABC-type multidrug transport system ATPase subunit
MPTAEESAPAASARRVSQEHAAEMRVLDKVDLDLRRGTITAILGPNGAGKTTLLRLLAGLLAPSEGCVDVLGVRTPAAASRWRGWRGGWGRSLRRRIGYVPQRSALDPEMTGAETLLFLANLCGVARRQRARRVADLAATFGVSHCLARRVGGWSGGERRRLHLAAGLVHDPDLLLLDEPTAGLDPGGAGVLWGELERRAAAGRAVAVVTHDLDGAERHAGLVVLLDRGRMVARGTPAELVSAHGQATLTADLAPPAVAAELLAGALAGCAGVGRVAVEGLRCRVEVPGGAAAEAAVLAALAALAAGVRRVEVAPPGLLGVWRRLIGEEP